MAKKIKETEVHEVHAGELSKLLQEYRESIGFSVTQTADALCLSETTIIRLENEEFDSLAEPPYIRGYLRNYAKLVEKDPAELIACYENLRGASPDELEHYFKPSPSIKRKSSLFPVLVKLFMAALIVAVLATLTSIPNVRAWFTNTWQSFSQQTNENGNGTLENNNPLLTGNMPAPLPIPTNQDKINSKNSNTEKNIAKAVSIPPLPSNAIPAVKSELAETIKKREVKQPAASEPASDKNTTLADKESSYTPLGNTVKVKLVFNEEVWLRIKNKDKKTVYEGQSTAGNEKELELEKPLTFRVGNAQGVAIFINGKPKDITEHTKGSVANFTVQ